MKKNQIKETFQNRKFKSGSYSAGVIVIAIAVVIVINLIVNNLPASITKIDLSFNQMYSITDTTKEFLQNLQEDVTIYMIAQTGTEDKTVMEMLDNYKAGSNHIKVETIDPIIHPSFVTQYTTENINIGSLIVVSEKRNTIIDAADLYETSMNYNTYQMQTTGFDGEGQITSAINYVTTDNMPVLYTLEGHNEESISESLSKLLFKANIELKSLNLATLEKVPEDASSILIYSPSIDISKEEADKLITYLEQGGSALIVDNYETGTKPNLEVVLNYYGVEYMEGLVVEKDSSSFFYPYPYYLAPNKNSHDITNSIIANNYNIFLPFSKGIKQTETARTSITVSPLLTTSDSAFLRVPENRDSQSVEKQEGDISGPFSVGVAISELHDNIETKLVVYSSRFILDESANLQVSGSNYELVMNSFQWLCEMEDNIAIEAKSFSLSSLQITAKDANYLVAIILVILPITSLGIGLFVWLIRRAR